MKINISVLLKSFRMIAGMCGILLCVAVTARAQCPLSMTVNYVPIQQISLGDIDFEHFESRALLFTAAIINSNPDTVLAQLKITLSIRLADGTPPFNEAVNYLSKPFAIAPGLRIITNLDISRKGGSHIETESFNFNQEAANKVKGIALSTGKFPAGDYAFNFTLQNAQCAVNPQPPVLIRLENPSRVELRSPRDGEITNEFPLFEFFHDGENVVLTVAEKVLGQSREDAMTRKPPMLEVELKSQNSYLYSGGRPLEQGKTYVWKVMEKTLSTGGIEAEVSSPVGLFTVSDSPVGGPADAILGQIEEILGHRYPQIFKQIHNGGFNLSGKYVLNGSTLSTAELLNLLNHLREKADDIDLSFE